MSTFINFLAFPFVFREVAYLVGLDFAPLYIYPSKHISVGYMRALLKELQGNPFVQ